MDDLRKCSGRSGAKGWQLELPEAAAEGDVLLDRQVLVSKEEDLVVHPELPELGQTGVVEGSEVDPVDLGAEGGGDAGGYPRAWAEASRRMDRERS